MDVIRHNDVAADTNSSVPTFSSKLNESFMKFPIGEQFAATMRIERHEVQWRSIFLKNTLQTWWGIRHLTNNDVVEALVPSACLLVRCLAQAPLQLCRFEQIKWRFPHWLLSFRMPNELLQIDAEELKSRVRELRRFL